MKRLLILLLGLGVALGVAVLVRERRADEVRYRSSLAEAEERFAQERAELNQALEQARSRPPEVVTKTVTVQAPLPPPPGAAELIDKLIRLKSGSGFADIRAQRQAVVYFEALVGLGASALGPIREFLGKFDDADYTADARRPEVVPTALPEEGIRRRWWHQLTSGEKTLGHVAQVKTSLDFGVPPTLRLGLFDVLHAIGGEAAEGILAEQLQRTGRAVEVAYLAHTLRDMGGDRYRGAILGTTHELLLAPPNPATGAALDERSKDFLYAVLDMFQDPTFTGGAVQLLVVPDGHLDHHALDYLGRTLQENIVPVLTFAWSNPTLTNAWDRGLLAGAALPHAATNQQASQLIQSTLIEERLPRELRLKLIRALEEVPAGSPNSESIATSRVNLLSSLVGQLQDVELLRELSAVRGRLQALLSEGTLVPAGKPIP
jgi:hypothetical protein